MLELQCPGEINHPKDLNAPLVIGIILEYTSVLPPLSTATQVAVAELPIDAAFDADGAGVRTVGETQHLHCATQ
jgi:hypothetical protein